MTSTIENMTSYLRRIIWILGCIGVFCIVYLQFINFLPTQYMPLHYLRNTDNASTLDVEKKSNTHLHAADQRSVVELQVGSEYITTSRVINRKQILILTYMRSGSTMMSEILRHGGNFFYSFEPLWKIYGKCYRREQDVCCRNSSCRMQRGELEDLSETVTILKSIFECNFDNLPMEVFESFMQFGISSGAEVLRNESCFKKDIQESSFTWCKTYISSLCKSSSGVIIKTLRIASDTLKYLLAVAPNVQIVHLFRDPRAVLRSRLIVADMKRSTISIKVFARELCRRIYQDVKTFQLNNFTYLPVMYDCLVQNPFPVINHLYFKLGLNMTLEVHNWLKEYLMGDNGGSKSGIFMFGVHSKNASLVANAWRISMPFKMVLDIDSSCNELYKTVGIRTFLSIQSLKDINFSSFYETSYTHETCSNNKKEKVLKYRDTDE